MPRPGRSHAADVAGEVAADGVVRRVPPAARALRAAARRGIQRRLRAAGRSVRARPAAGGGISDSETDKLFNMSPIDGTSRTPRTSGTSRTSFWRTLEEQAGDPAFQEFLCNEFPSQVEAIVDPVARRPFLKLMGASLALGG